MPALTRTKYESDLGTIHPIRLTATSAAASGTPPAGAVDSPIKVKISKGNSEYGIRPRGILIGKTFGTAPDTFSRTAFIPVLTPSDFTTEGFAIGESINYKGATGWTILGRRAEDY